MQKDGGALTVAPVTIAVQPGGIPARPEWIRLPRTGEQCQWTGLSRSTLWQILKTGRVKTVVLRRPGTLRGARLILLDSLLCYIADEAVDATPTRGAVDHAEGGAL